MNPHWINFENIILVILIIKTAKTYWITKNMTGLKLFKIASISARFLNVYTLE